MGVEQAERGSGTSGQPPNDAGLRRIGRALGNPSFRRVVSAAFFAGSAWLLWRQLSTISLGAFVGALAATPAWAVMLSMVFAAGSYACLSGTELLALRSLGHRLGFREAAAVAAPAYALTNSVGFGPATGIISRAKLYGPKGISAGESAEIFLVGGIAVTLSGLVAAGLLMLAAPSAFAGAVRGPPWLVALLGAGLMAPGALWFYASTPSAPAWLGGRRTSPSRRLRLFGLSAGLGDWLLSCAALYILLPDPALAAFPAFLAAYIASSIISGSTGVPGGIGVFEVIVLSIATMFAQVHETAAALLLYRGIYNLGPLLIWGAIMLWRALRRGCARQARSQAAKSGDRP